jgi:hypothetical protein
VSMVRYGRFADAPPPERELLDVADDGSATAWRSIGPAGGRFAGQVPDAARLRVLVEAALAVDAPTGVELPPDVVVETLEAGGRSATLPLDDAPAGPWADLAVACRAALVEVSAFPVAAIGASLGADGSLHLEHRGTEPLEAELGSMEARATLWRDGAAAWTGSFSIPDDLERTAVGSGWTLDLLPATPLPAGPGILLAQVDLVADDAGVLVPLTLTARADR